MVPTVRGLVVGVMGMALYGMAWLTQIGWFYIADALVWALLVVNLPLPWISLRGLEGRRWVMERRPQAGERHRDLHEEDSVTLALELRSRSPLPKLVLTITEHCPLAAPGEQERGFVVGSLGPLGRAVASYQVRCYRRGHYTFGSLAVETSAPFGLFRARRTLQAPLEVTVYPQILPMEASFPQGMLPGRLAASALPRPSGEFRGSREYRPGDLTRSIHWRNSARRGQLMVKEHDDVPQGEVLLAFAADFDRGQGRDTTLEYSIKIAASLAHWCFQEGRPFRMWPSPEGRAHSPWRETLEHLARLEAGEEGAVASLLAHASPLATSVVVVAAADRATLDLLGRQSRLSRRGIVVLLEGFDPAEPQGSGRRLAEAGWSVVPCSVGGLERALESLGQAMVRGRAAPEPMSSTSAHRPGDGKANGTWASA